MPDTDLESGEAEPSPLFRWQELHESSRRFAHAAAENFSPGDAAFFFLHAGASVELGVKAALCKVSPVLLVEGGSRFKDTSLVRLLGYEAAPPPTGRQAQPGSVERVLFTVGFEQALVRFALIYGDQGLKVTPAQLAELKAARDVTAHGSMGAGPVSDAMDRILVTLSTVHSVLAPLLGTSPEQFWAGHHRLIERVVASSQRSLTDQVRALYDAAQARFQAKYADVDPDGLQAILDAADERVQPAKGTMYRKCPVCGASGIAHERPEKEVRTTRRGGRKVVRGWRATDFRCGVCRLVLDSEELIAAAPDFEAFDDASPEDDMSLLDIWAGDYGPENLDDDDRRLLDWP